MKQKIGKIINCVGLKDFPDRSCGFDSEGILKCRPEKKSTCPMCCYLSNCNTCGNTCREDEFLRYIKKETILDLIKKEK